MRKITQSKQSHIEAFLAGRNTCLYEFLGAHMNGAQTVFRVWAPNARQVSVIGEWNGWRPDIDVMHPIGGGIWEAVSGSGKLFDNYKYVITAEDGHMIYKADPCAFHAETRPGTASKLYHMFGYKWGDKSWLTYRKRHKVYDSPLNIYELHPGSWRKYADGNCLSYTALAEELIPYVKSLGFTHIELMPITEYPLDRSWGYQCTGYFAPTSRYGTPHDFKAFVDACHQAGLGVILDWVPAHFPKDAFGLAKFDGSCCYEYEDPRRGEHYSWGTLVFDYGRPEVQSFLLSSALFWLREYHIDGLRVDAVASMLYLDYDREEGQWLPNVHGGKENLEAIALLKALNTAAFSYDDSILMIAEESTSWPSVTRPDGLGFNLKWNMGWMNDVLHYTNLDPYFRQYNHKDITFSFHYAFSENFVLPLSHDEVVHMKGSLIGKMPGDPPQQLAGVRAFYCYMLAHPGKKLLFMGAELGQLAEWNFETELDWGLLSQPPHKALFEFFQEAGNFYLSQPALWENDFDWAGFEWICPDDNQGNTAAFIRKGKSGAQLLFVCNFSPLFRDRYQLGVSDLGDYNEVFNSDDARFGGEGRLNAAPIAAREHPCHNRPFSIHVDVPPLGAVFLRFDPASRRAPTVSKTLPPASVSVEESAAAPAAERP